MENTQDIQILKNKISELLQDISLVILDFSAIVNVNHSEFEALMECIIESNVSTAVSGEFYDNYDVVINCENQEQRTIAKRAYSYLDTLKRNNLLYSIAEIFDNRHLVNMLCEKNNICYVFYRISEMAEAIDSKEQIGKAIIVDNEGALAVCESSNDIKSAISNIVDADSSSSGYFEIEDLPEEGTKVFTKTGDIITIGDVIGNGGEGTVYHCDYKTNYCIKIYHDGQLTKLRIKKMLMMEKKQVRYDGLCWPEKVVYTSKGEPVGYVMKMIEGKSLSLAFDSYESVQEEFPSWTRQNLVRLAIETLTRIQYLHLFGILIGDLRMNNIMLTPSGAPIIVDLDSCQIGNLPCPAGFGDFTPAELQRVEFSKNLRKYENESFACAVLVFKILFCGLHPYDQCNGADSIEEEIVLKSFPYPITINGSFNRIVVGCYDEMWRKTPYQMQSFLYDIFKNGSRPNIQTMIKMLKTYDKFIEKYKGGNLEINKISFEEE